MDVRVAKTIQDPDGDDLQAAWKPPLASEAGVKGWKAPRF
jgi:hypothetical protein